MYPTTRSGWGATLKEWPSMICVVTQLQLMKVLMVLPPSTLIRELDSGLSVVTTTSYLIASWVQVLFWR